MKARAVDMGVIVTLTALPGAVLLPTALFLFVAAGVVVVALLAVLMGSRQASDVGPLEGDVTALRGTHPSCGWVWQCTCGALGCVEWRTEADALESGRVHCPTVHRPGCRYHEDGQ